MKKLFLTVAVVFSGMMISACSDDGSDNSVQAVDPVVVDSNSSADQSVPVAPASSVSADPASSADTPATPVSSADAALSSAALPVDPVSSSSVAPVDPNVSYTYYGTELTGKEQFLYGRFEARMKMLSFPGSVSSMFLYYDPSYLLGDEPWNEIDIEVLGKTDTIWQANLITREPDVDKKNAKITSETKPEFGFHASEDFHLYGIVWTPEYIAWEIDSVEIRRDVIGNPDNRKHDQVAFINQEQSLRFNVWISGSTGWVGKFTGEELAAGPQIQYIDYVRVYTYDTTSKAFTFKWQDDFDGDDLDWDRWARGNWEMEKVMYRPENLVVKDGMAQMILDREAY